MICDNCKKPYFRAKSIRTKEFSEKAIGVRYICTDCGNTEEVIW